MASAMMIERRQARQRRMAGFLERGGARAPKPVRPAASPVPLTEPRSTPYAALSDASRRTMLMTILRDAEEAGRVTIGRGLAVHIVELVLAALKDPA